jgi:hypothetical protein
VFYAAATACPSGGGGGGGGTGSAVTQNGGSEGMNLNVRLRGGMGHGSNHVVAVVVGAAVVTESLAATG